MMHRSHTSHLQQFLRENIVCIVVIIGMQEKVDLEQWTYRAHSVI